MGIVHRDLKPENLFLTWSPEGEPVLKVLDFGVAKIRARDDADQTGTGALVGTPLYMSPEQASSDVVGPQADVWALGILAFRLLVGKEYWDTRNVSLLLAKIVYSDITAPSALGGELGSAFDAWFLRSCARNPLDRFAPRIAGHHEAGEEGVCLVVGDSLLVVDAGVQGDVDAEGQESHAAGLTLLAMARQAVAEYHDAYYAAFVLSPEGHNIEAVCFEDEC